MICIIVSIGCFVQTLNQNLQEAGMGAGALRRRLNAPAAGG